MSIFPKATHVFSKSYAVSVETKLVVEAQSVINLPRYPLEYRQIEITNVSASPITITAINPIYETLYAPAGTQVIVLGHNCKIELVYIIKSLDNTRGWYSVIT